MSRLGGMIALAVTAVAFAAGMVYEMFLLGTASTVQILPPASLFAAGLWVLYRDRLRRRRRPARRCGPREGRLRDTRHRDAEGT